MEAIREDYEGKIGVFDHWEKCVIAVLAGLEFGDSINKLQTYLLICGQRDCSLNVSMRKLLGVGDLKVVIWVFRLHIIILCLLICFD